MKKYMYTDAHTDTCISIAEKWQEAESSTFFAQHCVLCFPLISAPPPVPIPRTASCSVPLPRIAPSLSLTLVRWHTRCTFKCPSAAGAAQGGQEEPGAKQVVQENGENIPERTELHLENLDEVSLHL